MSRLFMALAAGLGLAILAAGVWIITDRLSETKTISGEGMINNPADLGGSFELVSHKGEVTTQEAFKGKYTLVYFGYSFCPDICPTGLQNIAGGLDKLGAKGENVVPVFISVDPERDTPDQLAQYVELFHPRMIGLTGSEEQIKSITKKFRAYYAIRKDLGEADYPVDHSAFTYLMDPNWKLIAIFRHGATPDNFADALKKVL